MLCGPINLKTAKTGKLGWRISFVLVHASVMNHLTLVVLLILAPLSWGTSQSVKETEQVDVSVYSPPVPTKIANPKYPAGTQARGIEGWVQLHFMVDPSGNTHDIEIVDSNGNRSIERAAIKAARKYKYQPGEYKGEPIDANNIC